MKPLDSYPPSDEMSDGQLRKGINHHEWHEDYHKQLYQKGMTYEPDKHRDQAHAHAKQKREYEEELFRRGGRLK